MLKIGDIVKPILIDSGYEYHIIVDLEMSFNRRSGKKEYIYQLMKIYPVREESEVSHYSMIELKLVGSVKSAHAKNILSLINRERKIKGFKDEPDYMKLIAVNLNKGDSEVVEDSEPNPTYDKFETIDEGLRIISDLNELHRVFGDSEFVQLKEMVIRRLKRIHSKQIG